jgi:hypothetical protein
LLVNATMKQVLPIAELGRILFPTAPPVTADTAVTLLMALGSIARADPKTPGLVPRIHNFFRGLPGLWVCMDPNCSEIAEEDRDGRLGYFDQDQCGGGS